MDKKRSPLLGHSQLSMYQTVMQLRSRKIIIYDKYMGTSRSKKQQEQSLLDNFGKAKTYAGNITSTSLKNLEFALDMLWQVCSVRYLKKWKNGKPIETKQHLSFITLTIPDQSIRIDGKYGYDKLLEPFIQWLIRVQKVTHYVWKAELQQPTDYFGHEKLSKGQLHYHIILPNYIDKGKIREKWNKLLANNNLLGGQKNPPSTHVSALKKATGSGYLLKEITKNIVSRGDMDKLWKDFVANSETKTDFDYSILCSKLDKMADNLPFQMETIGGKVWGCSKNLRRQKIKDKDGFEEVKSYFTLPISEGLEIGLNNLRIKAGESDFCLRDYKDGDNIPKMILDSNDQWIDNPKYSEYVPRFEIISVPNNYQNTLLNFDVFEGYDKDFKPIRRKAYDVYKEYLNNFGANIKVKETTKRKFVKLSDTFVTGSGKLVANGYRFLPKIDIDNAKEGGKLFLQKLFSERIMKNSQKLQEIDNFN